MWLEKRSRLLKEAFCAVCARRSTMAKCFWSADAGSTGELCARLAPATPSDGASAVQDVETEPRARAPPQMLEPGDWSWRDVQPKYFRGAERSGHSRWRKEQGDCACNQAGTSVCRCTDAAVLARLAGGGAPGASEPVPSLKGGVSRRSTQRVASASAACQESLGSMLCAGNPLGALGLGAKKLAKKLAPAPASRATAASAAAAAASTPRRRSAKSVGLSGNGIQYNVRIGIPVDFFLCPKVTVVATVSFARKKKSIESKLATLEQSALHMFLAAKAPASTKAVS